MSQYDLDMSLDSSLPNSNCKQLPESYQKLDSAKTVLHHVLSSMTPAPHRIKCSQVLHDNLLPSLTRALSSKCCPLHLSSSDFCPSTGDFDQIGHNHLQRRWVLQDVQALRIHHTNRTREGSREGLKIGKNETLHSTFALD